MCVCVYLCGWGYLRNMCSGRSLNVRECSIKKLTDLILKAYLSVWHPLVFSNMKYFVIQLTELY